MCSLNTTANFPVSTLTHMFGQGSILKTFNVHITTGSTVYKQMSPETPPRYKRVLSIQVRSQAVTFSWLVGWLCLTSHRQRGHLETAPPFTVPCKGREAR